MLSKFTSIFVLLNACDDIGLAVNTRKTKYMEVGRHRRKDRNMSVHGQGIQFCKDLMFDLKKKE